MCAPTELLYCRAVILSLQCENSYSGVDLNNKAQVFEIAQSILRECMSMQAQSLGLLHTAILLLKMMDMPGRDAEHLLSEMLLARFFHLGWIIDLENARELLSEFEVYCRQT